MCVPCPDHHVKLFYTGSTMTNVDTSLISTTKMTSFSTAFTFPSVLGLYCVLGREGLFPLTAYSPYERGQGKDSRQESGARDHGGVCFMVLFSPCSYRTQDHHPKWLGIPTLVN